MADRQHTEQHLREIIEAFLATDEGRKVQQAIDTYERADAIYQRAVVAMRPVRLVIRRSHRGSGVTDGR